MREKRYDRIKIERMDFEMNVVLMMYHSLLEFVRNIDPIIVFTIKILIIIILIQTVVFLRKMNKKMHHQ